MTDNFDFKKFLVENKLGAYSKAGLINEGGSSTAHMMARQAMQNGMSPEEAAEELEISGIDPIKAKAIVNDVYGENLSSDLEMGDDDDFGLFQEGDDVIYGRGDDDDYDRKRDAQSSGARFVPITDPSNPHYRSERSPSKWGSYKKPDSFQDFMNKLVDKVRRYHKYDIENYTFKKDKRKAAEEAIIAGISKIVDSDGRVYSSTPEAIKADIAKRIFGPIRDQWKKYAQSKAPKPEPGNEPKAEQ